MTYFGSELLVKVDLVDFLATGWVWFGRTKRGRVSAYVQCDTGLWKEAGPGQ